jgi:hypothetical protein
VNYRVKIPNHIKRQIATLPGNLGPQVLRKLLVDLAQDPNRLLGEVIVPLALRAFHFTLQDASGQTHVFMAAIDGVDPASSPELRVVAFRHTPP